MGLAHEQESNMKQSASMMPGGNSHETGENDGRDGNVIPFEYKAEDYESIRSINAKIDALKRTKMEMENRLKKSKANSPRSSRAGMVMPKPATISERHDSEDTSLLEEKKRIAGARRQRRGRKHASAAEAIPEPPSMDVSFGSGCTDSEEERKSEHSSSRHMPLMKDIETPSTSTSTVASLAAAAPNDDEESSSTVATGDEKSYSGSMERLSSNASLLAEKRSLANKRSPYKRAVLNESNILEIAESDQEMPSALGSSLRQSPKGARRQVPDDASFSKPGAVRVAGSETSLNDSSSKGCAFEDTGGRSKGDIMVTATLVEDAPIEPLPPMPMVKDDVSEDEEIYEAETLHSTEDLDILRSKNTRYKTLSVCLVIATVAVVLGIIFGTGVFENEEPAIPTAAPTFSIQPSSLPSYQPSLRPTQHPSVSVQPSLPYCGWPDLGQCRTPEVDLSKAELGGSIPREIGNWTHLVSLNLGETQLTGTIPTEVGLLTNLTSLSLYSNALSGTIPTELGLLTGLVEMTLFSNDLTGTFPTELGGLASLKELRLYSNRLTGTVPTELGSLQEIEYLNGRSNALSGTLPSEMFQMTKLTYLSLRTNDLTGTVPTQVGWLTGLSQISISQNDLTGTIPTELGLLTLMEAAFLYSNRLTGTIPTEIGLWEYAVNLNLRVNVLNGTIPSELFMMTRLTYLSLRTNEMTGTIPPEVGQLTQLEEFWLYGNHFSGTIPTEIGMVNKLKNMNVYNNEFTGTMPSELFLLTKLTQLVLRNNMMNGTIPSNFELLTDLQKLYADTNLFSGTIPSEVSSLSVTLELLDLHSNKLTGTLPSELGDLAAMTDLSVRDNLLTGTVPSELGRLTLMTEFWLFDNDINGTISFCGEVPAVPRIDCLEIDCSCCADTDGVSCGT